MLVAPESLKHTPLLHDKASYLRKDDSDRLRVFFVHLTSQLPSPPTVSPEAAGGWSDVMSER